MKKGLKPCAVEDRARALDHPGDVTGEGPGQVQEDHRSAVDAQIGTVVEVVLGEGDHVRVEVQLHLKRDRRGLAAGIEAEVPRLVEHGEAHLADVRGGQEVLHGAIGLLVVLS